MNDRSMPPRIVPTLTEVVQPAGLDGAPEFGHSSAQREWVQRALERLEPILDEHLRSAIERVVLEHTEALAPRLREQVEAAVRAAVAQVLAQDRQA